MKWDMEHLFIWPWGVSDWQTWILLFLGTAAFIFGYYAGRRR